MKSAIAANENHFFVFGNTDEFCINKIGNAIRRYSIDFKLGCFKFNDDFVQRGVMTRTFKVGSC